MELDAVIRRRRMCRNFSPRPVPAETVDRMLDRARRAPSAGHSQGWAFLVLSEPDQIRRFWQATSDPAWLAAPDLPGLLVAPVVVVPFFNSRIYLDRYSESDKATAGLGEEGAWPAPYWLVDTAFATMLLLLGVVEEGLGALFFRLRGHPGRLRAEFGVPDGWRPIGAVAIGWEADEGGPRGSAGRGRRPLEEVVHRGRW